MYHIGGSGMKKRLQKIDIPTWAIVLISVVFIVGGFVFYNWMTFNNVIELNDKMVEKGVRIDIPKQ